MALTNCILNKAEFFFHYNFCEVPCLLFNFSHFFVLSHLLLCGMLWFHYSLVLLPTAKILALWKLGIFLLFLVRLLLLLTFLNWAFLVSIWGTLYLSLVTFLTDSMHSINFFSRLMMAHDNKFHYLSLMWVLRSKKQKVIIQTLKIYQNQDLGDPV